MPRNIEIKARLTDRQRVETLVAAQATYGPETLIQHDLFFHCASGRLKLRIFADKQGELIHYQRADGDGPKCSTYSLFKTAEPDRLRELLTAANGLKGEVKKTRTLYLIDRTRVHLDQVEQLGDFLELEVVLQDEESSEIGEQIAQALMHQFGISSADLIPQAYLDLLAAR